MQKFCLQAPNELANRCQNMRNRVCNVYAFQPTFHFAYHRWWNVFSSSSSACINTTTNTKIRLSFPQTPLVERESWRQDFFFGGSANPITVELLQPYAFSLTISYPTTNDGEQNERSVGIYTHCIHVFARMAPICMLSRCLLTEILHRSLVGSLLRVRCRLGNSIALQGVSVLL